MNNKLKQACYYLWKNSGEPLLLTGVVMILGTIMGAIGGEIADHLPYFKLAVPEGIAYLTKQSPELFYGHLDKIGTAIGLISSAFIRYRIRLGIDSKNKS